MYKPTVAVVSDIVTQDHFLRSHDCTGALPDGVPPATFLTARSQARFLTVSATAVFIGCESCHAV